jgi:hypothetical protein
MTYRSASQQRTAGATYLQEVAVSAIIQSDELEKSYGGGMKHKKTQNFRPIGRGFVVSNSIPGGPAGRSLAMAYRDQNNKKYIEIKGNMEPLEERHCFLAVD